MAGYKLATYQSADGPRAGLVVEDKVFDAAKLTGKAAYATVLGILDDWRAAQPALKKAAAKAGKSKIRPPARAHQAARAGAAGPRRSIVRVRTTPTMPPRWRGA